MESTAAVIPYSLFWTLYVWSVYAIARKRKLSAGITTLSHVPPTVIALTMIYLFVYRGTPTIVQFAAGSEQLTRLWSAWVGWFPIFLAVATFWIFMHFVWLIAIAANRAIRPWWPIAALGLIASGIVFLSVAANSPSA